MIIDYIGQELIWNLTATHPYKQNRGNYSIAMEEKVEWLGWERVILLKVSV